jgi:hypothetical protein
VLAKSAQAGQNPDIRLSVATYQRQIGERSYYLAVVLAGSTLVDLVGCYLYDFAADQPMMPRLLIDWLEGVPNETKYVPGTIIASKWDQPTGLPGTIDVFTAFVPAGSGLVSEVGFSGLVLKLTSVDTTDRD